jgi:hypothetical protein
VDSQGYAPSEEERTVDLLGQAIPGRLRGKEHVGSQAIPGRLRGKEHVGGQAIPGRLRGKEHVGDDDEILFPEQTRDDTDRGWGEHVDSNDERLFAERPPHWD